MRDLACVRDLAEDALSHLRRRLDGEGDGDELLGLLDRAEEADVALHQELGLPRAGRRLNDERAAHVERFLAGARVGEDLHFLRSGCGLAVAGHGLTLCFDYRPRAPLLRARHLHLRWA